MSTGRSSVEHLRTVIDCLPSHTREAMLEGIRTNEIIVGAYSDRDGGVCPMLAAHRCGGRTSFISFAKAWDAFTGVKRARRATVRELGVLERHLVASLVAEGSRAPATGDLAAAITEHSEQTRARRSRELGDAVDMGAAISEHQSASRERRSREAAETGGWGFLKERRERGDAERALERLEREQSRAERRERELV